MRSVRGTSCCRTTIEKIELLAGRRDRKGLAGLPIISQLPLGAMFPARRIMPEKGANPSRPALPNGFQFSSVLITICLDGEVSSA
ncbi:hypothetical protein ACVIYL_008937 [Bradyrhizobium sp. USDA 3315]